MFQIRIFLIIIIFSFTGCSNLSSRHQERQASMPSIEFMKAHPELFPTASAAAGKLGNKHFIQRTEEYDTVPVYYATDRKNESFILSEPYYGNEQGEVSFGRVDITIPPNHMPGELEKPKWYKFELNYSEYKHVTVVGVEEMDNDEMFEEIRDNYSSEDQRSALIYVHGYNVSFFDAARRTGQMAYDLNFRGTPYFYSWKSQNKEIAYTEDEAIARASQVHIENYLQSILDNTRAEKIYLIGHSMGTRALTDAFLSLSLKKPTQVKRIKEIILAAPDIDAETFKNRIAPEIIDGGFNLTLYASSQDKALMASKLLHGGRVRAGDTGKMAGDLIIIDGMDTIDASAVNSSFMGHSYYAEERTLLFDIKSLIKDGLSPEKRIGLKKEELGADKIYWTLRQLPFTKNERSANTLY